MSYVINSKLLDVDYRQKHIINLLKLHINGEDYRRSEVYEWGMRTLKRGAWWYGVEQLKPEFWEAAIQKRQYDIIALYESIKEYGYDGSTISVYFDKQTGQVHTYDGFHRLSIIEYLGRNYDMNCVVSYHHPTDPNQRGDFPLAERIRELNGGQEHLYQPCEDPRVSKWSVWRPDSEARLNAVLQGLTQGSVLDVGCSSGWFSRSLARFGYKVTGLEANPKRLGVARYLAITQNLAIEHCSGRWQTFTVNKNFDNILMLSVLHHDILAFGAEQMWRSLETLRDTCNRLIIEFPLSSKAVVWLKEDQKDKWSYSLDEFTKRLQEATQMKVRSVAKVHPARPIITLENQK